MFLVGSVILLAMLHRKGPLGITVTRFGSSIPLPLESNAPTTQSCGKAQWSESTSARVSAGSRLEPNR
jgi:hypothetical protein